MPQQSTHSAALLARVADALDLSSGARVSANLVAHYEAGLKRLEQQVEQQKEVVAQTGGHATEAEAKARRGLIDALIDADCDALREELEKMSLDQLDEKLRVMFPGLAT